MNTPPSILKWSAVFGAGVCLGLSASRQRRRVRYSFFDRTVLITGGSRGLGLILAREFAREGARIAILARDETELKKAQTELLSHGSPVLALVADVTKRAEIESAVQRVHQEFGGIDVVVNNAGVIEVGPLENMSWEDFQRAMDVHYFGPLAVMLAVIPEMKRRGGGRIVNISSIGGKVAVPHLAPYIGSKFALVGLSDSFRSELRKFGILVTTVCPGLMRTGSAGRARFKGRASAEHAWFSVSAGLPLISMDADRAARKILEACRAGAASLILSAQAKALVWSNAVAPGITACVVAWSDRLLPAVGSEAPGELLEGREIGRSWWQSWLTRLSDSAARKNNET